MITRAQSGQVGFYGKKIIQGKEDLTQKNQCVKQSKGPKFLVTLMVKQTNDESEKNKNPLLINFFHFFFYCKLIY